MSTNERHVPAVENNSNYKLGPNQLHTSTLDAASTPWTFSTNAGHSTAQNGQPDEPSTRENEEGNPAAKGKHQYPLRPGTALFTLFQDQQLMEAVAQEWESLADK